MHVNHHHQLYKNVDEIIRSKTKKNILFFIFNLFYLSRTPSPRSATSRSRSRSSIEGSKSPVARNNTNNSSHRSPSPPHQSSSSSSKRRRRKGSVDDSGRHICAICSCDVEGAKRLYGVLDNCDHILYVYLI